MAMKWIGEALAWTHGPTFPITFAPAHPHTITVSKGWPGPFEPSEMNFDTTDCCVLNGGPGSWAFEPLAEQLSSALGVAISAEPRRFNYVLSFEDLSDDFSREVFIQLSSIRIASDKRLLAEAFQRHGVPTPHTVLLDTFAEVVQFVRQHAETEWCFKFPTGCGGHGHRIVNMDSSEPKNWPRPFVLQEFIRLERPEVYRIYCADGDLFGWVARRFPAGCKRSPWVVYACGARYERLGEPPSGGRCRAHSTSCHGSSRHIRMLGFALPTFR